jgi:hypothetical protein
MFTFGVFAAGAIVGAVAIGVFLLMWPDHPKADHYRD